MPGKAKRSMLYFIFCLYGNMFLYVPFKQWNELNAKLFVRFVLGEYGERLVMVVNILRFNEGCESEWL